MTSNSAPNTPYSNSTRLNGPPLRKIFSPSGPKSQQPKLTTLTPRSSSSAQRPSSTMTSAPKVAFNIPALGGSSGSMSKSSPNPPSSSSFSSSNATSSEKPFFSGLPAFAPSSSPLSSKIPSGSQSATSPALAAKSAAPSPENNRLLQLNKFETWQPGSTGGKIKSKVTEKGRGRAEKGLLGEGAPANDVPDYLKNASSLPSLPVASNNAMPSFKFNEPSKAVTKPSSSFAPTNSAAGVNFTFEKPEVLSTTLAASSLNNVGVKFSFAAPQSVKSEGSSGNSPMAKTTQLVTSSSNLPDLTSGHGKGQSGGFGFGAGQSKSPVKPVSNGLGMGSGLTPATSLKSGSVMDILGGKIRREGLKINLNFIDTNLI